MVGRGHQIREAGKGQAMEGPKAMGYSVGFLKVGRKPLKPSEGVTAVIS